MTLHHMTVVFATVLVFGISGCGGAAPPAPDTGQEPAGPSATKSAVIDHTVESLDGDEVDLASYRGRPMLIVNTASKCGYTPQYAGLQELYERYSERGLVVIAFPSNDFGNQEPGSPSEIRDFCQSNYSVTFPLMAKVHTKGPDQAPIYRTLTGDTDEGIRGEIRWNFTKFLVDGDGHVVARFDSEADLGGVEPEAGAGHHVHFGLDDGHVAVFDLDEALEELAAIGLEFGHHPAIKVTRLTLDLQRLVEALQLAATARFAIAAKSVPQLPRLGLDGLPRHQNRVEARDGHLAVAAPLVEAIPQVFDVLELLVAQGLEYPFRHRIGRGLHRLGVGLMDSSLVLERGGDGVLKVHRGLLESGFWGHYAPPSVENHLLSEGVLSSGVVCGLAGVFMTQVLESSARKTDSSAASACHHRTTEQMQPQRGGQDARRGTASGFDAACRGGSGGG
jgi:glutathione peroxidase